MKNVLVTGGAGFIGSNFINYLFENECEITVVNLDLLTYAGNLDNLKEVEKLHNYYFIKGDINDKQLVSKILVEYDINTIINFAAESHVDNSINDSLVFSRTNILGTHNLLEAAKKYWQTDIDELGYPVYRNDARYLQVSTDEVYGSLGKEGLFTEESMIQPNSPYSASKASADHITLSYNHTFKFPCLITRCSNNYGPKQHEEKLIPLMISNAIEGKRLPVYGDGRQIRDWLYVEDHCNAIWTVINKGKLGEVYNVGGNNEQYNIDIVNRILTELNASRDLIEHVQDRLGHDRRYAIDNSKIRNELGWNPRYNFINGLKKTIDWYIVKKSHNNYGDLTKA